MTRRGSWSQIPIFGPWCFGATTRGARFFEPGEVRLAILSLLAEGPKHGYLLMKELEERSGGVYKASAGTIYPTLQQLEDEDLIAVERENGKRVYRITAAGRRELESAADEVSRIWDRADQWGEWGRFSPLDLAFVAREAGEVMKAALEAARRVGDDGERRRRVQEILEGARRDLEEV